MDDGYVQGGRWRPHGELGGSSEVARSLAEAAAYGLPVERFIRSTDSAEVALLGEVLEQARKLAEENREDLARRIVNNLAESLKGGGKG